MTTNVANPKASSCNLHNDLVEACKRGDPKAQFQIYKLYYKVMYNISISIVNNPTEAEDIMRESFLSVFEEMGTYSEAFSFYDWLIKIVQDRSIDRCKKNSKVTFEDFEHYPETEPNCGESPTPNEEQEGRIHKVIDAIKCLLEICRSIYSLYFLKGYYHKEISETLSISNSTSRSQLSRVNYKLISLLKDK